jgi:hypothetical protein
MADYSFFYMGILSLVIIGIVLTIAILLITGCIITAVKLGRSSFGPIGAILSFASPLTCGLTAPLGLIFGVIGIIQKEYSRLSWSAAIVSISIIIFAVFASGGILYIPSNPGFSAKTVEVTDQVLAPYRSALDIDRKSMKMPPLPTKGELTIETYGKSKWNSDYSKPACDVILRFFYPQSDKSNPWLQRNISLEKTDNRYRLIEEYTTYGGPGKFSNQEGTFNEFITIAYIPGQTDLNNNKTRELTVTYNGSTPNKLTIEQAIEMIRQWGYEYETAP